MTVTQFSRSMALHTDAIKVLPGGVSSNARISSGLCPTTMPGSLFVSKAQGSHIWDVDGNEYIDYRMGFGPVILGHSHPRIRAAVHAMDDKGIVYALPNELEIKVAKRIVSMVPSAKMVRFANSGTEAAIGAIRVARGFTSKEKIVKFEGMYHGWLDALLFSTDPPLQGLADPPSPVVMSMGIPKAASEQVIIARWNDFDAIEKILRTQGHEIAAVITEPVMGNCAAIMPRDGYLRHLRDLCNTYGVVLIFDEVKTGFRVGPGGAQERFGVIPDISMLAKAMGNGYPVSCIVGRRDIMDLLGTGKVVQGGTYSANPISLAAVDATLSILQQGDVYAGLGSFGRRLMKGLGEVTRDAGLDLVVNGLPEMFQICFTQLEAMHEYRDIARVDMQRYASLYVEMISNGVMLDSDNQECFFTSASHSDDDLQATLSAFSTSLTNIKAGRLHPATAQGR